MQTRVPNITTALSGKLPWRLLTFFATCLSLSNGYQAEQICMHMT